MNLDPILLRSLCGSPLLLRSTHLSGLLANLTGKGSQSAALLEKHAAVGTGADKMRPWDAREAVQVTPDGIAVIQARGMVYSGVDSFTAWIYDLCRPEAVQAACAACLADPKIKAVVFDMDSPGGTVSGTPETGEDIADLTAAKPTFTHVSGQACSAAYWWAAQTGHISAAPTADVGCVGTYAAYFDYSRMLANMGVDAEYFIGHNAKFKAMGAMGNPLTSDQRAFLQASVDRTNTAFLASVKSGRPTVADEDLQGQWFDGEQAVAKGFADSVNRSLPNLLAQIRAAI